MAKRTCSIDGCDGVHYGRGWCSKHWARWWRHGTTDGPPSVIERFWDSVDFSGDCWLWTGVLWTKGYGSFSVKSRRVVAHRFAYEALVGPIPEGLTLDHLCRVRHCVNPGHLEPVTRGENVLRGVGLSAKNARKTHCKWGHPFDEENTYMRPTGGRACRTCRTLARRRHAASASGSRPQRSH